ncbi:beta-ketoacyl synthase N-terminal-like domain-containing protein [Paenibacillus donghaensis]|uniref:beta-ketoacyl synthase N-terminal-like domain-containing protein n=1 Tax=Paenibacillus donghaensis TaxID=414771 RepID=UPI0012FE31CE|nr:beta-ketoacyl synthase N-terminal-like domain-containing protein [Paenibacillus donghaensis]
MQDEKIVVTGVAAITASYPSLDDLIDFYLNRIEKRSLKITESINIDNLNIDVGKYINKFKIKKMSNASVLSVIAAGQAIHDANVEKEVLENSGVVFNSLFSTFDKAMEFYDMACETKCEKVNSSKFANSTSCAPTGEISAEWGMRGSSMMLSGDKESSFSAIRLGYNNLRDCEQTPFFLVGGVDVYFNNKSYFYSNESGTEKEEGVAAILLEKSTNAFLRSAKVYGEIQIINSSHIKDKINNDDYSYVISNDFTLNGKLDTNKLMMLEDYEGATASIAVVIACKIVESIKVKRTVVPDKPLQVLIHLKEGNTCILIKEEVR